MGTVGLVTLKGERECGSGSGGLNQVFAKCYLASSGLVETWEMTDGIRKGFRNMLLLY